MKFYKILTQKKKNLKLAYKEESILNNFNYFNGSNKFSFAVEYSPNEFNSILSKNDVFSHFLNKNICQVIMTDHKYKALLNQVTNLCLKVTDVSFNQDIGNEDYELQLAIERQDVKTINDELSQVVDYFKVSIKEITFRNDTGNMIKILSNGTIGLDENYLVENSVFSSLIDFLSLEETA